MFDTMIPSGFAEKEHDKIKKPKGSLNQHVSFSPTLQATAKNKLFNLLKTLARIKDAPEIEF